MKQKLFNIAIALGLFSAASLSQAKPLAQEISDLTKMVIAADIAQTQANLINWKVGDFHKLKIEFIFGGGAGKKEATKEDKARNAIWLVTDISLMGQQQKTEVLYNRATGEVLEMIVNGQKQDPGQDGEFEIIEQKETEITVPAGKFDCIYIKAKVKAQGQENVVQLWANPIDVNLDGMLKAAFETQFGELKLILEQFGPR